MKSGNVLRAIALRVVALLVMVSGMALCVVVSGAPVVARGAHSDDTSGYSMTIVASSTDLKYGQNVTLTATLSYPASNPPDTRPGDYHILFDGQGYGGTVDVTETSPVVSFYTILSMQYPALPGQHTATAVYVEPTTNVQVTSSPITLTEEKINGQSTFDCQGPTFVGTGQSVQFHPSLSYSLGGNEWSNATVTVKFVGPTTVVSPPLVPDSTGHVAAVAPIQAGNYQVQCIFSGNSYYTAGQFNWSIVVSHNYGLSIKLYSDPSPLNLNTKGPFTLYLVLQPGAGVPIGSRPPIPTGQVYFQFGNGIWGPETLNSDGTLLATFKASVPFGNSRTEINVQYDGDTNYAQQNLLFQQAQPPIPDNTGGSGSGNPGSGATATPNPNATVTATVTTIATATTHSAAGASNSPTASVSAGAGPNWALIVGLIVAVLALIGGVGGFFLYRLIRARRTLAKPDQTSPYDQAPRWDEPPQSVPSDRQSASAQQDD